MPKPEFRSKESILASIIRVDHAGEYGAMRIYSGQIDASLCNSYAHENDSDKHLLEEMLEQEKKHLSYFESQIKERKVRPTALMPFWHVAGYMLGFITRMIGKETAMLCTEAVEDVIESHYEEQLESLHIDDDLKDKIQQFRLEELEHRDIAINNGSKKAPMYLVVRSIIKGICKSAISISKVV